MTVLRLMHDVQDDPFSRVMHALRQRGPVHRAGAGFLACCPAHGDKHPSLSVRRGDDGRVLFNCQVGCSFKDIVGALGMEEREMFADDVSTTQVRERRSDPEMACSLKELAGYRKLPVEFLASLGWQETHGKSGMAIAIPYLNRERSTMSVRYRRGLSVKDGVWWASGQKHIIAYEPDGGELARSERYLIVCEGETDTATLLYAGFPALGCPGATNVQVIEAHHVECVERVFYVREPDRGGDQFAQLVPKRLAELGFAGAVHELKMPNAAKDPSALWVRDPEAFPGLLRQAMADASRSKWRWLHEVIPGSLKPVGERLTTGFETLDRATRGGIPLGRFVVLVGAPGAAKTTLSTYLADRWERAGATVVYLAADEPADGIILRLGQLSGWSRESLEGEGDASDAVRAGYAARAAGRRIVVLDPDVAEAGIEEAAQALQEAAQGRPRVLVVDSLQTARCGAAAGAETDKARVDAVVKVCKRIARSGALVVGISEMSRAGYRGGAGGNISALAAAKESGAVEYGVSLALGLTSVKGADGQIDVEVAKNRIGGGKPDLRLQLDFARASLAEIARPEPVAQKQDAEEQAVKEMIPRVLQAIAKRAPGSLRSRDVICTLVKGNTSTVNKAISRALLDGHLAQEGGAYVVKMSKEWPPDEQ